MANDADWFTAGPQANPIANQVLADTGALDGNWISRFHLLMAADVAVTLSIQHRDSANAVTIKEQRCYLSASAPVQKVVTFKPALNERVRIVVVLGVTGNVSASISGGRRESIG